MKSILTLLALVAFVLACAASTATQATAFAAIGILSCFIIYSLHHAAPLYHGSNSSWAEAVVVNLSGRITRTAKAALAYPYMLVREGANAGEILVANGTTPALGFWDMPGYDGAVASGDIVEVTMLNTPGITRCVAHAAFSRGDVLVDAGNGYVKVLPTSGGGAAWVVGIAVTDASAQLDVGGIRPCSPYKVTIAA